MNDIPDEIKAALQRVEDGSSTTADADTIRKYLAELEREIESYEHWERSINEALNSDGMYIP